MLRWVGRKRRAEQQTLRPTRLWQCIAALAGATGDDQLGDALAERLAELQQLSAQLIDVEGNGEALRAFGQALDMPLQQTRPAARHADRFEQPVAIGQSAIVNGQSIGGLPVQPAQRHSANRRNTSEPLVPPNPNELETTTSIGRGLAWFGTKSRSQPSSGSSRLMVGGATWS